MDADKKPTSDADKKPADDTQQAPADALSRTPDELEEEQAEQAAAAKAKSGSDTPTEKKVSPLKKFLRKINLYFLMFVLLIVVAGAVAIVNYLNSQITQIKFNC